MWYQLLGIVHSYHSYLRVPNIRTLQFRCKSDWQNCLFLLILTACFVHSTQTAELFGAALPIASLVNKQPCTPVGQPPRASSQVALAGTKSTVCSSLCEEPELANEEGGIKHSGDGANTN